ncbi:MAG: protein kinase [Planctomycetaceae bacterium]|nr:protein kinase [Planctomycetaceae bacterium]
MSATTNTSDTVRLPAGDGTEVQDDAARDYSRQLSQQVVSPPSHVPGFEILRCLGVGSFGSVWLAREVNTGRRVAIKFYSHRRGLDWSLLSREVEKLAVLYTSRDVVGLLDVGWNHDPPYFVMEYLENGSLAGRLKSSPLPIDEAVHVTRSVARALVHAHSSGILHCDVKPANVLLDRNDEARLGDFGQSRLSDDQSPALGTMFYMAPEQADLQAIPDARWDVYALGALLYHTLCGHAPYRNEANEKRIREANTLAERLEAYRQIIETSPRPDEHRKLPGVDRELADIIDRCLHPEPQHRFTNAQIVLNELDRRDHARARRPLTILGFLGPILFLLAMLWIAWRAVPAVVEASNSDLIDGLLEGDEVAASVLAHGVEADLLSRQDELEELARSPELREFIHQTEQTPLDEWRGLTSPLNEWQAAWAERLREADRSADRSWFLTNAAGDQLARIPLPPENFNTIGDNFARRSYFHGGVEEYDPSSLPGDLKPRTKPGISTAFRSDATHQYMVAIAVPVWDEAEENVIGILARTIDLPDLLSPWEQRVRGEDSKTTGDNANRFLSLVDTREERGFLLDHHWMTREAMREMSDAEIEQKLRLSEDLTEMVTHSQSSGNFRDPVATAGLDATYSGDWLAAFAPVKQTGWVAVVQERRAEALRPFRALESVFWQYGIAALVVFSLMLGILWYLIHRAST